MNGLRITLFVIALVTLASQTFRHAYVRWLEPRTSVLDKYGTQTEQQILAAKSLQELVALYDAARTKMKDYEKAHPGVSGEPSFQPSSEYVKLTRDEESLKNAINEWEQKSKDVHELWHFWIAGMVAFLIGSFASLRGDRWVGIALLILAFSEMVYATSPTFRSMGAQPEVDHLLVLKFILSVVSLILLFLAWTQRHRTKEK